LEMRALISIGPIKWKGKDERGVHKGGLQMKRISCEKGPKVNTSSNITQVSIESNPGISFKVRYDKQTIFEQLSDNLYPDALSAIREIGIQNPFDADATICSIDIDPKERSLTISDNGLGMDLDTILKQFLVIGASKKKGGSKTSKFKRRYIGSKGIGRLSWQKLGRKAVIRTECEDSAHVITLNRNDMSANVKEVFKKGHHGTTWKIFGPPSDLCADDIYDYVSLRSGVLLEKITNFKILVNSRIIEPKRLKGACISLASNDFEAKIILGKDRMRLALTSNHIQIDDVDIAGLGGYIESGLFCETITRDRVVIDDSYNQVIGSFYNMLIQQLVKEAIKRPSFVRVHRDMFIELVMRQDLVNVKSRLALVWLIPVKVIGKGWKTIGELATQNDLFVEFSPLGKMSGTAERAGELGIDVILTSTPLERALVELVLGAKETSQIPSKTLDSMGATVTARGKNALLLVNAGKVVALMTPSSLVGTKGLKTSKLQANKEPTARNIQKQGNSPPGHENGLEGQNERCRLRRSLDIGFRPTYLVHKKECNFHVVNGIKLAICKMDKRSIIALANPLEREIYFNINSPIIKKIKKQGPRTQQALLLEEISHELAHILGYGLQAHDTKFFKVQRKLKYLAIENI